MLEPRYQMPMFAEKSLSDHGLHLQCGVENTQTVGTNAHNSGVLSHTIKDSHVIGTQSKSTLHLVCQLANFHCCITCIAKQQLKCILALTLILCFVLFE